MNRRSFFGMIGAVVVGAFWRPKVSYRVPFRPIPLEDQGYGYHCFYYNSKTGRMTDTQGNEIQNTFTP